MQTFTPTSINVLVGGFSCAEKLIFTPRAKCSRRRDAGPETGSTSNLPRDHAKLF